MKINIKNIDFSYNSVKTLQNISLVINPSEFVCILGPNGSGKSTLLKCINRILKVKIGSILLDGHEIQKLDQKEIAKQIGYVPQVSNNKMSSTVFNTVLLGRRPYINWNLSADDKLKVMEAIKLMELEELIERDFNKLSGGEQQKVILTRALAQEPAVLLVDEPTNNLDLKHQMEVLSLISDIKNKKNITVLMAIHDLNHAARYADKVIMMNKGKICYAGKPAEVLNKENIRNIFEVEVLINQVEGIIQIVSLNTANKDD